MDKKATLLDAPAPDKTKPSVVESMQEALKKAGETVWDFLDSAPSQPVVISSNHTPKL